MRPPVLLGPLLAAVLVTAGCSGGAEEPPAPAAPAPASAAPAASATASPSLRTLPTASCLSGRYRLVRFVGVGASQSYGTGQGGDVDAVFRDKAFTLTGAGRKPVVVTVGGQSADLTVDGTAKGRFAVDGATTRFTTTSTDGSATLRAGEQKKKLSMREVAAVVGLDGSAKVACTDEAMTVTLESVRLEFGRV